MKRCVAALLLLGPLLHADGPFTAQQQAVVEHISADSLKGHLSFLASDLLEGRATPSRGLDLAAEYIASQIRRMGLEPAGDDGYFQTATLNVREPDYEGLRALVTAGDRSIEIQASEAYFTPSAPLHLENVPLVVVSATTQINAEAVNGKVVLLAAPQAARQLQGLAPALVITLVQQIPLRPQVYAWDASAPAPVAMIAKPELATLATATITIHSAAAKQHTAKARNVAGILRGSDPRGSDPTLRDTYVMLTSHYDHLGLAASGEDRIYNGANDDASGTSSVIEVAGALAAAPERPKRSVLFVLFFGEENGLMGSRYYGRHPLVPPSKTVADLNLEQVGRTDAGDGPQIKTASITGFDFSDVPRILTEAGALAGVRVYKNLQNSDAYFSRSDNQPLADLGVPAHTLCVAYEFPDYHRVSDHWDKIDYLNMAAVDRAVALGIWQMASEAPPPRWNESYGPAKRYADAAKKLQP